MRELLEGLNDPSYQVREAAAHGLASRRQPEVVEALLARLEQDDTLIRPSVIWALGELQAAGAVEMLEGLLAAPDRHARAQAALALGKIGQPVALPYPRAEFYQPDRPGRDGERPQGGRRGRHPGEYRHHTGRG